MSKQALMLLGCEVKEAFSLDPRQLPGLRASAEEDYKKKRGRELITVGTGGGLGFTAGALLGAMGGGLLGRRLGIRRVDLADMAGLALGTNLGATLGALGAKKLHDQHYGRLEKPEWMD